MTKVIMNFDEDGSIMFDCLNHAGDYDVCTIVSTLTNVLVEAVFDAGCEPTTYNPGHVRIDLPAMHARKVKDTFRIVKKVFDRVQKQNPDNIKIY